MKQFRLIVTGGGTGGHITPGLAVIDALKARIPGLRILWVGVRGRREEDLVPRHNIPLQTMNLRGLERSFKPGAIIRNFTTGLSWAMMLPVLRARKIIQDFQPDCILGTGGYVCAPVMVAGKLMGIRTWILEQNSVPGLAVKVLSRLVDGVGIAFDVTRSMLPVSAPVEFVGNPVTRKVLEATREEGIREFNLNPRLKTLLVMGGSLGSTALNNAVLELLKRSSDGLAYEGWQIIHSVGLNKFNTFMGNCPDSPRYSPLNFIYETHAALAGADLILCRAGAMTLAEITARGLPGIVVPWPGAVRNHQYTNAQALSVKEAAILIPETELSGAKLAGILRDFREFPGRLEKMANASRSLSRPDAAETIADLILAGKSV